MTVFNEKDEQILKDYLHSYKECFEAMNDLLNEIVPRIELTDKERELAMISDAKYKNMVYHIRKWTPTFKKLSK
jgi:hypothetical protein